MKLRLKYRPSFFSNIPDAANFFFLLYFLILAREFFEEFLGQKFEGAIWQVDPTSMDNVR